MSQHSYSLKHNGEETNIMMGWDKPLQYFFMIIEKESDIDEPFWSNLNQLEPYQKNLNFYLKILNELNIKLPPQMIEEVMEDQINNIGNKTVGHVIENGVYYRIGD